MTRFRTTKRIRGILFDKDGTLFDFAFLWEDVARVIASRIARHHGLSAHHHGDAMLARAGVMLDFQGIAKGWTAHLREQGAESANETEMLAALVAHFNDSSLVRPERVRATVPGLREGLEELKKLGFWLGVASNDNLPSVWTCLRAAGMEELFHSVAGLNGSVRIKPHAEMLTTFAAAYGLDPSEIAMVGDSVVDMEFARNAGALALAVTCGVGHRQQLEAVADAVCDHPLQAVALIHEHNRQVS
jgi:phosphoglycolate phosphatase